MSDLRIVLLGKSVSENSLVGNFILGRAAFDSEAPPDVVERVGGRLKDRHLIIINSPQLLQRNISDHQITQTVRECVFLSDPGPHVIVLLLRPEQCSAEDQERVEKVLLSFSERIYQHTIVISTQESTETSDILQRIIQKCANRHFRLKRSSSLDDLLQAFEDLVKINDGHHLDCGSQNLTVEQQTTERQAVKLNLVVCGTDGTLKSSISERILQQTNRRSDMELHSHLINLISLPALNQLSEEEVMRQSLYCVSLCHPGVHVFIIVIPVGPLTDEDKAETEKIQRIFDSREHFILLFTTSLSVEGFAIDLVKPSTEAQILISLCGGQYKVMGLNEPENSRQIPELLEYIEKMKTEPYSLQMYMKAQKKRVRRKTEEKYKEELKRMENKIKELKQKIQSKGAKGEADDQECLRIVLIGRTGNGKSATGNTILGRNEFESKASTDSVTTDCQKELGEVDGRSVAVVDTPGLFDTTLTNYQVTEEIVKCVSLLSPGPHVFVIVLSVTRFTKEETDTLDLIKKIFGPKAAQFSIVLFTRGDDLEGESIEDYLKRSKSAELKKLIRDCGNRFLAFSNREKQDKTQVIQLLNMIEEVKNSNQGRYFTNSMFEEAEMSIKKRMEEILKEKEREIQTQIESLKAKYELDMKIMSKRLEEEKQRADEEKIKMENQLKKIEEKVFFEKKEKTEQEKREIENQKRSEEKQQRAEYYQKTEEMKREIEKPRSQYEKQQKEKEDRKREKKYRQDQEKMNKRTKDEHEQECNIAEKKLRNKEEKERKRWKKNKKRKIKETENDRKEVQEETKGQQREWEDEKKRQMREREEGEKKGNEKQEQLREKQKELEKIKKFEREREERQKIEDERQKKRIEREEKEREYKEKKTKMERHKRLEQERKDEWEKRKREDNERREEERKRWKNMIEDLKQEREEMKRRERERRKREEKERDEMKQKYEEEIKVMKKKYEDEARKQAEVFNDFRERKKRHKEQLREKQEELEKMRKKFENDREVYVQEITGMLKDIEEVEKEKDEDIKELHQEVLRRIARNKNSWFFQ